VRLAFLGTPDVAVRPLDALVAAGHDVQVVVTRADARRGRGASTSPSPVKAAALRHGIPVSHRVDDVLATDAELGVVVAFGQLIKPHVLAALPMVNVHFSLLPRWRGAAPVERALLAGDEVTGVCLMDVEEGLDTGAVHARVEVPIGPETTAAQLRARLIEEGTTMLVDALAGGGAGLHAPAPQVGAPTYAAKLDPSELRLDWSRPAIELDRIVRVGGAWTTFRGVRVKIIAARLADGVLEPVSVQPEGRPPMPFEAWRNGARLQPGEWFA
jgi:methionyl-tRNA formyltransferase